MHQPWRVKYAFLVSTSYESNVVTEPESIFNQKKVKENVFKKDKKFKLEKTVI